MNPANDDAAIPDSTAIQGSWQMLPNETASAYTYFGYYLDLGADATHQQVADKTGKSLKAIQALSVRYRWVERARAWSQYLAGNQRATMASQDLQDRKHAALRQNILRQEEWERAQKINKLCNHAIDQLMANPQIQVAYYQLPPLLRAASQARHEAVTIPPLPEDKSSDPATDALMAEFEASMALVTADFVKREAEEAAAKAAAAAAAAPTPPAQPAQSPSTDSGPPTPKP
jgi:hypothetical protein